MTVNTISSPKIPKYRLRGRMWSTSAACSAISGLAMAVDEVQEREQEDPDDVDEVPVEPEELDGDVPLLRERPLDGHPENDSEDADADDHVQRVHARQGEVQDQEDPDLRGDGRQVLTLRHIEEAGGREQCDRRAVRQVMAGNLHFVFEVFDDEE